MIDESADAKATSLSALFQADHSGNQSNMQATITITNMLIAYLAATLFIISQKNTVNPWILACLGLPVYFLQSYQMMLAASVMRRAASASLIEEQLVKFAELTEFTKHPGAERIGTKTSDRVMDLNTIRASTDPLQPLRFAFTIVPYVGFYVLGIAYTGYIITLLYNMPDPPTATCPFLVAAVTYFILWVIFVIVAVMYILRPFDKAVATAQIGEPSEASGVPSTEDVEDSNEQNAQHNREPRNH